MKPKFIHFKHQVRISYMLNEMHEWTQGAQPYEAGNWGKRQANPPPRQKCVTEVCGEMSNFAQVTFLKICLIFCPKLHLRALKYSPFPLAPSSGWHSNQHSLPVRTIFYAYGTFLHCRLKNLDKLSSKACVRIPRTHRQCRQRFPGRIRDRH